MHMEIFTHLPDSVLQWLAIFLSIIIEALPFVLLGSIMSGFIEIYVTPDLVQKFLPKQKYPLFRGYNIINGYIREKPF